MYCSLALIDTILKLVKSMLTLLHILPDRGPGVLPTTNIDFVHCPYIIDVFACSQCNDEIVWHFYVQQYGL